MSHQDKSVPNEMDFRDLKERILRREIKFPPQVEKLAAVCLARPELFAFETTTEIAAQASVPRSTIARFVRLLGRSKLKDTRAIFQNELKRRAAGDRSG
jgi:DNA-binding MurR/RpiR family transcriptional regulator